MGQADFFFGYLNSDYNRHYHDCYEFHYILKGGGFFIQEGGAIPLQPDTFLVSRPGEEHSLSIESDLTFYFIRYKPDGEERDLLVPLRNHYRVSRENRSDFSRLRLFLGGIPIPAVPANICFSPFCTPSWPNQGSTASSRNRLSWPTSI